MTSDSADPRPSLAISVIPLIALIGAMTLNVVVFESDAAWGPNQLALLGCGILAGLLGYFRLGVSYKRIEKGVMQSINASMGSLLILLIIGSLIGVWIVSGIVPTIIYYGLKLIHPLVFLPFSCITCALVSLATGSSWTTTGTIGVALIAIGQAFGIPLGMVAGAVISGAYFGDKMSPLSDTTNLAPAMAGTTLFVHIRHMMFTSGPALGISLVLFAILGAFYSGDSDNLQQIDKVAGALDAKFGLGIHLLLVPVGVLVMVAKRIPALPALVAGTALGIVFALVFQADLLAELAGGKLTVLGTYEQLTRVLWKGFKSDTGMIEIDKLLSRGGMESMLPVIWLVICAMLFGGVLEATGMLQRMADTILTVVRGSASLVGATIASCMFVNLTAGDQYMAIVIPGRMFKAAYKKHGLHPKNLSRAIEDGGTVTSVLVPWNSGGAYNAGALGVPTLTYLPFCFFNILSPLISVFLASMNWTIDRIDPDGEQDDEGNDIAASRA